jgi:hypothetical protein
MKRLTQQMLPIMLITMTVLFIACSKEGPAGAKGDTGAAGPAGPAGPNGPKGDSGVANVTYSAWLDVGYAPDTIHTGAIIDTIGWFSGINAPKITNDILNRGVVKVFLNANTPAQPAVLPLPLTDLVGLTGVLNIHTIFSLGTVNLYATDNASTFTITGGIKVWQYRYVIIPGGVAARSAIDWNNYESVKKYLGIKD